MEGASELAARIGAARARRGPPLLLDGALGTELERRGAKAALPLWSARALLDRPELVEEIHREYAGAGAELLTANTFRTQRRTLAREGLAARAAELTRLAVELARRAARGAPQRVLVLGSQPPLEDCFRPDLVPGDDALAREHGEHAESLAGAGADAILIETMNAAREAAAAARAASGAGAAFLASFRCGSRANAARLLSGEPLARGIEAVARFGPLCVGVNCVAPAALEPCLEELARSGFAFHVYPNLGQPDPERGGAGEDLTPEAFALLARGWVEAGAAVVGGCCGTTPAHIRALARALARGAT
jgi:S-methylmethionine-dependent homocysteine/selenocysteine methylase